MPHWIKEGLIDDSHAIPGTLAENLEPLKMHTRRLDRMLIDVLAQPCFGQRQTVQPVDLEEAQERVLDQIVMPEGFQIARSIQYKTVRLGDVDVMKLRS